MGSGKSVVAKMLAEKLGWPRFSMGDLRRQKAKERGMTLSEYNKLGESDPSTDLEVDNYQKELGEKNDNFIIEGRTSWHFIPRSFKIFLEIDEHVGANFIWKDLQKGVDRNEDMQLNSVEDVIASVRKRVASDKTRYKKYFNIDVYDKKNYDLVIDTTGKKLNDVCDGIIKIIKDKFNIS